MSETARDPRAASSSGVPPAGAYTLQAGNPMVAQTMRVITDTNTPPAVIQAILAAFDEPPAPTGFYARYAKSVFERVVAAFLLIPAAPVMAFIALAIRLDSPGPALLRQKRVGLGGVIFEMLKFRSMVDGAERSSGPVWAAPDDPRVTALGRWLRSYRLDELPQLINVLRGEMSLVGPRPERPTFVARLQSEIPKYAWRHAVKPGITGHAQVSYKYATNSHETLVKLLFDLEYIRTLSLWRDVRILLRTIPVVLSRRGAA